MTTKNAILMIVKQNNGVDYNSLLAKFSSSYSNVNSARAALSRSLKDLTTFGFLERRGNRFFLLPKGEADIYAAVKNKLVLSLNTAMKQKHPGHEIDSIVQKLHILIERGKEDKDLLKTSKTSLDFHISDLEGAKEELDRNVKHLEYLSRVFGEQIGSLKEMDFYDQHEKELNEENAKKLSTIFRGLSDNEFVVECYAPQALAVLAEQVGAKPRETSFVVPKDSFPELISFLAKNNSVIGESQAKVFSSLLKAQFRGGKAMLSGPYSEIQKWRA